ncbi:MAG: hypothetical protein HFH06_13440 [Lachnospiraceae bacterium]|nr:hypothetical protein [Lachnospiraceae bacterium]
MWDREKEYRRVYETKKEPEGVYVMNQFCSSIEKDATVEDIPDILRLYYDRAITSEQNEFVTIVLCAIVERNPREAAKNIIANVKIFQEEEAEEWVEDILRMFLCWNPKFKNIFMEEVKNSNIENQMDNILAGC